MAFYENDIKAGHFSQTYRIHEKLKSSKNSPGFLVQPPKKPLLFPTLYMWCVARFDTICTILQT